MANFISKEVVTASEAVTSIILICNQPMRFSVISSEAKIHSLTSLTMIMTIFSMEDLEVGLEIWVGLDRWVDFMRGLEEVNKINMVG